MGPRQDTIRDARRIRRMFGGIARRYDLLNHLLSLNRDRRWRARAVREAKGEGPVLDVCCGTGDLALEWAGSGRRVVGTDFSVRMLRLAAGKDGRVPWCAADTLRLPFRSGAFGTVSVAFGIRNVSDLRGGIREMARVARPGGRVAILEFTIPRNFIFRAVYLFYFLFVLPIVGNLVSGTEDSAYGYLPRSVLRFPDRERLGRIMEAEGLGDVRRHDLSLGIVNLLVGVRREEGA